MLHHFGMHTPPPYVHTHSKGASRMGKAVTQHYALCSDQLYPICTGYLASNTAVLEPGVGGGVVAHSIGNLGRFHMRHTLNVDVGSMRNRWCHNWNPFVCCTVANAAQALATVCIYIKAGTFLCLLNLQKLTQNTSKCTNLVHFWQ